MNCIPIFALLAVLQSAHSPDPRPSHVAPVEAPAPAPAASAAAMRIAAALANEDLVRKATVRIIRDQTPKVLAKDPGMQMMEQHWPGITGEFLDVMEPIIVTATIKRLPAYRVKVAEVFDRRMTSAELEATAAFYTSPTGRRVLALAVDGLDYGAILQQQIASGGKAEIAAGDIHTLAEGAAMPAIRKLDPAEMKVLMTFGVSPAGLKVNQMRPEIEQLAARENNVPDPVVDAEITKAVGALVARRSSADIKK